MNSQPASSAAFATRGYVLHTDPLIASVALTLNFFNTSTKRQKPTRMPYSCHAQLGRSGNSGCPALPLWGGGSTVRGMLRSIDHSSTLTMIHTAMRAPSGSLSGGRSTIAEYGMRSLGSFIACST
jgi:hypothetical protein